MKFLPGLQVELPTFATICFFKLPEKALYNSGWNFEIFYISYYYTARILKTFFSFHFLNKYVTFLKDINIKYGSRKESINSRPAWKIHSFVIEISFFNTLCLYYYTIWRWFSGSKILGNPPITLPSLLTYETLSKQLIRLLQEIQGKL